MLIRTVNFLKWKLLVLVVNLMFYISRVFAPLLRPKKRDNLTPCRFAFRPDRFGLWYDSVMFASATVGNAEPLCRFDEVCGQLLKT